MKYDTYEIKIPTILSEIAGPLYIKTTLKWGLMMKLEWADGDLKNKIKITKLRSPKEKP